MLLFMFDINPCSIFLSLSSSIYYCHSISAVNSQVLKLKTVFPIQWFRIKTQKTKFLVFSSASYQKRYITDLSKFHFFAYLYINVVEYWRIYISYNDTSREFVFFSRDIKWISIGFWGWIWTQTEVIGRHYHLFDVIKGIKWVLKNSWN